MAVVNYYKALIRNFLYSCLLDVVFTVQLRGRWPKHTQNACFLPSTPKKSMGQSMSCAFLLLLVNAQLSNCYCYAIVKR